MARTAMTAVENLEPFEAPTPTVGDNIHNSGDGMFFEEVPGRPATLALYNLSASTTATVTFSAAPGAPGPPANKTLTFNGAASLFVVPPGWLPQALYRRDDGQGTNPRMVYVDASHDLVMACLVRGPAGWGSKGAACGAPAITGSRTLVTPQIVKPLGTLSVGGIMTDTDGLAYYPAGSEALLVVRGAGTQTLTLSVNPNNPFGRTSDITISQALANEMILVPPGVYPPSLLVRNHATNPGVIYFSSDQAASTRYALAGLA